MKKAIKISLFVLIMLILFLPLLQQNFHLFRVKKLDGFFLTEKRPDTLTWKTWSEESFQKKYNQSVEDSFGLREILIRINNQLNYWLYKENNANNVVIGKNNCLYQEGYILDYTGYNFLGPKFLDELLRRTKLLQDTLKKVSNTDLIVMLESGKASFYPEYIPDRYHPKQRTMSNMRYLEENTKKRHINCIDLNSWFCSMKDTSHYALYATYGVHWSTYGMYKAADTISRFIEHLRHIDMPEMLWQGYTVTNKLKDADFDIEATLNLLFELPHQDMCYPQIAYNSKPGKVKPKLLVIGDSYYWGMINNHVVDSLYRDHEYWYYFKGIWPDIWTSKNIPQQMDLQKQVEKQDVILLGMTELNAFYGFWEFIEALFHIYYPGQTNADFDAIKKLTLQDMYFRRHHSLAIKYHTTVQKIIDVELKNRKEIEEWLARIN